MPADENLEEALEEVLAEAEAAGELLGEESQGTDAGDAVAAESQPQAEGADAAFSDGGEVLIGGPVPSAPEIEPEPLEARVPDVQETEPAPEAGAEQEPAPGAAVRYLHDPKRLGLIAAIAVLVALGIWAFASRASQSTVPSAADTSAEETAEEQGQNGSDSDEQASSAASTKVYGDGSLSGVDESCTDRFGNPTVHAALELPGSVLETLLQSENWQYYPDDRGWLNAEEDALVMVLGELDWLTDDQISQLAPGALGSPAIYTFAVTEDQYASAADAFEALAQVNVLDQEWTEGTGLAVVAASDGTEVLVMVTTDAETGIFSILTVNEEALAAGLFDAQAGGSYGTTPREVFARMCGREVGGTVEQQDQAEDAAAAEAAAQAQQEAAESAGNAE